MDKYINAKDVFVKFAAFFTPADIIRARILIKQIPAADVRKNKHGKWILYNPLFSDTLCCFECEFNVLPEEAEVYNFCPICGADMRKG